MLHAVMLWHNPLLGCCHCLVAITSACAGIDLAASKLIYHCSLSRGERDPSLALLVGEPLLRCAGKLLLPVLLASKMRAAAMPLARLCSAMPSRPAVADRGETLRGLTGAKPSTSLVSTVRCLSASVSTGLLRLAGRCPIDALCLQTAVVLLPPGAGGCSILLLSLVKLVVLTLLLDATDCGGNRPEALKPAQDAATGSCCCVLLVTCSLDAAAGCSNSRPGSDCSSPATLQCEARTHDLRGEYCCGRAGNSLAGETVLAALLPLHCSYKVPFISSVNGKLFCFMLTQFALIAIATALMHC
jgi:hypothetical protein